MHPLIAYEWMYGVTECLHIIGFAVAIGTTAIVDLQLMGLGLPGTTAAAVEREMAGWTLGGTLLAILSGLVILSTDASRYLAHSMMQLKLALTGVAILLNYAWHRRMARQHPPLPVAKPIATLSLVVWSGVVFASIFYAFT